MGPPLIDTLKLVTVLPPEHATAVVTQLHVMTSCPAAGLVARSPETASGTESDVTADDSDDLGLSLLRSFLATTVKV